MFFRNNGLTIALMLAFFMCLVGMALSGWLANNELLAEHHRPVLGLFSFLTSPEFQSALFENWESEFLQMAAYVLLTAMLFQKGSAESRDPDAASDEGEDGPSNRVRPDSPWPVRAGGLIGYLYSYSLGTALFGLFVMSFVLHWTGSAAAANAEAALHNMPEVSLWEHLTSSQLWFESFQNWQSEFLATAALVVLSIFLRHRGSPESKPVAAPHHQTGG
jgi:hypothetical protein